jgi:hypothetical protein
LLNITGIGYYACMTPQLQVRFFKNSKDAISVIFW